MFSEQLLRQLLVEAEHAALAAGRFVQDADRHSLNIAHKTQGHSQASTVVTQIDQQCEAIIQQALTESMTRHDIAWLAEEGAGEVAAADHARFEKTAFWCVDPLDGTLPFVEGRPGYSVSIALVSRGGQPLLGVVYDPVSNRLFSRIAAIKKDMVSKPQSSPRQDVLHWYLDESLRSHSDFVQFKQALTVLAENLGLDGVVEHRGMGAVMNACGVIQHRYSCYFKLPKKELGGGCIWDYAASAALFESAGKVYSDAYGNPLALNRRTSYFYNDIGVVFSSNRHIHQVICQCLQDSL